MAVAEDEQISKPVQRPKKGQLAKIGRVEGSQLAKTVGGVGKAVPSYVVNAWARTGNTSDACYRLLRASSSDERPEIHSLCFLSTDDVLQTKLRQLGD